MQYNLDLDNFAQIRIFKNCLKFFLLNITWCALFSSRMKEVSFSRVELKEISPSERELPPLEEAQKHCLGTVWRRSLSRLESTGSGFEFGCLFLCLFLDVSVIFG